MAQAAVDVEVAAVADVEFAAGVAAVADWQERRREERGFALAAVRVPREDPAAAVGQERRIDRIGIVAEGERGLSPVDLRHVEPVIASDTSQSLRAGRRVSIPEPETIADGLRAREPGELTFAVNSRLLDDVVTVSEDDIVEAMRFCFTRLKIVVEPSGAVPLAALLSGAVSPPGRTVVVLSGGNIDPADFSALTGRPRAD